MTCRWGGMQGSFSVTRHELLALLRASSGSPFERITHALTLLAEDLDMQVAYLTHRVGGRRVVTHAAPMSPLVRVGAELPEGRTVEDLLGAAEGVAVPDVAMHPALALGTPPLPAGIASYLSVPLPSDPDGALLACASTGLASRIGERDLATAHTVALHVAELLAAPAAPGGGDLELSTVASAVAAGTTLEELTRPLLELLQQVTDLESTYLTTIDWRGDEQHVAFSLNSGDLEIPEGLTVEWSQTLCRRSLEEGRPYVDDVPAVWGDSDAARELGIVTYVSVPVLDATAGVVGTLCGASKRSVGVDDRHLQAMQLFGRLVGEQLARESTLHAAELRRQKVEDRTRGLAGRDPVTGLHDANGVVSWLATVLPTLDANDQLAVALVRVDRLDDVNHRYGTDIGDEVLRRLAQSLGRVARLGDLVGRLGGDRFVVAAVLPASDASFGGWSGRLRRAAYAPLGEGDVTARVVTVSVDDPASTPDDVLALADRDAPSPAA